MLTNRHSLFDQIGAAIYSGASYEYTAQLITEAQTAAAAQGEIFDINAYHPQYAFTLTVFAVLGNNVAALNCMIELGASIAAGIQQHNLLEWALSHPSEAPSPEMLALLTSPHLVAAYQDGTLPFHIAAVTGNLEPVEAHLRDPAVDKFFSNLQGLTAFKWASLAKQNLIANKILEDILQAETLASRGFYPLHSHTITSLQETADQLYRNYLCGLTHQSIETFDAFVQLTNLELFLRHEVESGIINNRTTLEIFQNIPEQKSALLQHTIENLCYAIHYYSNIQTKQPNDHKEYIKALRLLAYSLTKISVETANIQLKDKILSAINQTRSSVFSEPLSDSNIPAMISQHANEWEVLHMTQASRSCNEKIEWFLNHFAASKHHAALAIAAATNATSSTVTSTEVATTTSIVTTSTAAAAADVTASSATQPLSQHTSLSTLSNALTLNSNHII